MGSLPKAKKGWQKGALGFVRPFNVRRHLGDALPGTLAGLSLANVAEAVALAGTARPFFNLVEPGGFPDNFGQEFPAKTGTVS